ncbi:MAG: hypothetical protein RL494_1320 [Bacteroidota bacterium]
MNSCFFNLKWKKEKTIKKINFDGFPVNLVLFIDATCFSIMVLSMFY